MSEGGVGVVVVDVAVVVDEFRWREKNHPEVEIEV